MTVLAIDLAAKYSAALLMDEDYTVVRQFDSWGSSELDFIDRIVSMCSTNPDWGEKIVVPEVIVVEDLPHGLNYSTLIKSVCRLQGRIYHALSVQNSGDKTLFLSPAEWRRTYEGMQRGTGPAVVVPVSERYGYVPPDLSERAKIKGGKAIARKVVTDYCSAYLIARWAIDTKARFGTYDVVGTSRYTTGVIRKKDVHAQDR